jgi:hypothetical protein
VITPVFTFDSRERWFPVGVEESLEATKPHGRSLVDGAPVPEATRLDFPAGMRQPELPPVGYHRVKDGGHLWWHQFWLWYLYNPKVYAGVGAHEGDWEFVQIGCADKGGDRPVLITGSQHHSGGKREFWRTVRLGQRPVVYVARDSHANYFTPVADIEDQCDGKGRVLEEVEWRPFGPWASWPGRWGNSTGKGQSPESPGRQGFRWSAPHLYHGQAR